MTDKKVRILAAGDLHSDVRLAERLAEKAQNEKVDYVVLCGDLSHFQGPVDGMMAPFKKRGQKVFIIPGNHDNLATISFLEELYGIKSLHGYGISIGEIGLFGCGGSDNVGPAPPIMSSDMAKIFEYGHNRVKHLSRKVMISHMHPKGSISEKFSQFVPASETVRQALDKFQPELLLCCHVHEAEGIEEVIGNTKVINVGKEGKVLEL